VEINAMCGGMAVQIDAMCGGVAMEIDACVEGWRCYGVEGWRCYGVEGWRCCGERENEMRGRERYQVGKWGFGVFFSLNSNGRAGGYPPDKKLKTRSPPETRMRKIIISVIRPYMTHGRAGGRTGRAVLSGGSVFTGFCPPLVRHNKLVYKFI
jgi:hypothetical protein